MAITAGQALALGSTASVSRDKPFTNAVIYGQKMDLAREEKRARQEAERAKKRDAIYGRIGLLDGKTTAWNAEKKRGIIADYMASAYDAAERGDELARIQAEQIGKQRIAESQADDDNIMNFLNRAKSGQIHGSEIADYVQRGDRKGLADLIAKNPQYSSIVTFDSANDKIAFREIPKVNLEENFTKLIDANQEQMEQEKFVRKRDVNTDIVQRSYSPAQINNMAKGISANPDYQSNIALEYPKEFKKYYQEESNNFPEGGNAQWQQMAAERVARDILESKNKRFVESTRPLPMNINLGLGDAISALSNPKDVEFTQKFTAKSGGQTATTDQKSTVFNFGQIPQVNGAQFAASGVRDLETGELYSTQAGTVTGNVGASGVGAFYKPGTKVSGMDVSGKMVPKHRVKQDESLLEYKVFIPLDVENRGRTKKLYKTIDDINEVANSVVKGDKTTDAITLNKIKKDFEVAAQKNSGKSQPSAKTKKPAKDPLGLF